MALPGSKDGTLRQLLPIGQLQDQHYAILTNALSHILSSAAARTTYGQIIDGVPLSSVALDVYDGDIVCAYHPLLEEHLELSPDVVAKTQELCGISLDAVEIDGPAILDYQAVSPGSRAFQTRLIELVARAVHAVAVWLYKTQSPLRPKDDRLLAWRPDTDGDKEVQDWYAYIGGFPPTLFVHPWYRAYDQYPDGVADGVGYWAENQILGGVVLFDRRPPEAPDTIYHPLLSEPVPLSKQADAIYFHTSASEATYRIYRLHDDQKQTILEYLLSDAAQTAKTPASASYPCPLPVHPDGANLVRVDPEEPLWETGIYRDKWERRPMTKDDLDVRKRDVIDTFNFLSSGDFFKANTRGRLLRDRLWQGDLAWP